MARKNTQAYSILEDNIRIGGNKSKSKTSLPNYDLPNGMSLDNHIDFVSPDEISPHPENAKLFNKLDEETPERWQSFIEDIKQNGIHDTLIVRISDMVILTGHRRHKAAIELKLETVPVRYLTGELIDSEAIKFMVRDNAQRRHWSNNTWLEIYRKIYPDFDNLLFSENRGGDRKSSKIKGVMTPLIFDDNSKLTAKKIAIDTGQKFETVKTQFRRIRKKLKNGSKHPNKKANEKISNANIIISIHNALDSIKENIALADKKTKKEAAKLIRNFSKEIDSEI